MQELAAGDGPDDHERLGAGSDLLGKRRVQGLMGNVFFAGEEAQERAALLGDVVADGAAEHGITGFEGIQNGAGRDLACNVQLNVTFDLSESAQM